MHMTLAFFIFFAFTLVGTKGRSKSLGQKCDPEMIYEACGSNERCIPKVDDHLCVCKRSFVETDGECVEISTTAAASVDPMNRRTNNESTSSGSSVAVGFLVPTFLIVLGGIGFCCARRYRLLPCRQNLYGNVLVTRDEDDDDDPPIA